MIPLPVVVVVTVVAIYGALEGAAALWRRFRPGPIPGSAEELGIIIGRSLAHESTATIAGVMRAELEEWRKAAERDNARFLLTLRELLQAMRDELARFRP